MIIILTMKMKLKKFCALAIQITAGVISTERNSILLLLLCHLYKFLILVPGPPQSNVVCVCTVFGGCSFVVTFVVGLTTFEDLHVVLVGKRKPESLFLIFYVYNQCLQCTLLFFGLNFKSFHVIAIFILY